MAEKRQRPDEDEIKEEIVETVKDTLSAYLQSKARQLAENLLPASKMKGWEIVGGQAVNEAAVENGP